MLPRRASFVGPRTGSGAPGSTETVTLAWARLMRVSHQLLAEINAELKKSGLPPLVWYDVLLELSRESNKGLRPFELTERMLLAQYNMSRLLARMEDAGLIERYACTDDGRGQVIRITRDGQRLCRETWAVYEPALRKHLGMKLTDEETRELARLLGKVLER